MYAYGFDGLVVDCRVQSAYWQPLDCFHSFLNCFPVSLDKGRNQVVFLLHYHELSLSQSSLGYQEAKGKGSVVILSQGVKGLHLGAS